ncbi:MAG: flagellar assembly protein FliW [Planctomycetota bacterium]|nr:MAG: flagellar assembly protein FliW [Planctomycetota bacterium]
MPPGRRPGAEDMVIETSRFGGIEVDDQRFLNFPRGILGFPDDREFALIQTGENSAFYWMQAVHRPELAFVVCDPRMFLPDYQIAIKPEDLTQIGLSDTVGSQVFVIVNKVGETLTANLQGPLLINVATRVGKQLVLSEKKYTTRHELMKLPQRGVMARTA